MKAFRLLAPLLAAVATICCCTGVAQAATARPAPATLASFWWPATR